MINLPTSQTPPVRLNPDYAAIIVLIFVALWAIHWFRRAFRPWPTSTAPQAAVEVRGDRVSYFDIVERLFHWSNFVVLGTMVLSGVTIFFPGPLNAIFTMFGVGDISGMILLHTSFAWGLLVLIIIHIVWDTGVARGFGNIWLGIKDIGDGFKRAKNFLGISEEYPRDAKYDIFMKTYHWGLTVFLVIQGITGIYFMNPYGLMPGLSYGMEYLFRILHDTFAFLLIGLIMGHIYFAIIPANWQILKAMVTGTASKEFYVKHFDTARWRVRELVKGEAKERPIGG